MIPDGQNVSLVSFLFLKRKHKKWPSIMSKPVPKSPHLAMIFLIIFQTTKNPTRQETLKCKPKGSYIGEINEKGYF